MSRGIHMPFIIDSSVLVRLKMGCGVQRKQVMLVIELMGKYFAVECPAKRIGHHADEQQKHD